MEVYAYDATGNNRVKTPVKVGDELSWKRNGTAGVFRCKVLEIREPRIKVEILFHEWYKKPINKKVWITRGVFHVYPQGETS